MQILGTIASSKQNIYISAMDSISTTTLSVATTSVTLSSIPQTYDQLQLRVYGRSTNDNTTAHLYVNNDTTDANYRRATGDYVLGVIIAAAVTNLPLLVYNSRNSDPSQVFATNIINIYDYSITSKYNPNFSNSVSYCRGNINLPSASSVRKSSAIWKTGFQQITSLTLVAISASFAVGTKFELYGINVR